MAERRIIVLSLVFGYLGVSMQENYILHRQMTTPSHGIYCSPSFKENLDLAGLFPLLREDNAIGIYSLSLAKVQVCYDKTKAGLVNLSSLIGGYLHTTGRWCPKGFLGEPTLCHKVLTMSAMYEVKEQECTALGGYLTKVDSLEEAGIIAALIHAFQTTQPLIGLRDVVGDNALTSYRWDKDNSSLGFTNWNSNEPSMAREGCVMMRTDGKWNDVPCGANFSAICETDSVYRPYGSQ